MPGLLVDPVPGNIGLLPDSDTVILLPFAEPTGVSPSDVVGTLADLSAVATDVPVVDPSVGFASAVSRRFSSGHAFRANDQPGKSSLLQRDVTIQAIIAINTTDSTTLTEPMTLIARGIDGSAAEYYAFGLEFADNSGWLNIRMFWADIAGIVTTEFGEAIPVLPAPGEPFLLTVTRRWESSTSMVINYYFGDEILSGPHSSATGVIGGGTTGTTSIGARRTAGVWGNYFDGWIDELKITNHEMSFDEVRATWARLNEHQPNGVASLRANGPPGAPFLRPGADSDIGRLLKAAGQSLGFAAAKAHELRDTHLPSSAYRETIARWETLVGLQTHPRLALDTRRARVIGHLERDNGYAPDQIRIALEHAFDLFRDYIELIEFSPTIVDDFTGSFSDERWYAEPDTEWSVVGDELQLSLPSGADIRFDPATSLSPCHIRMPVDNDDGLIVQVALLTYWTALPAAAIVGLFLQNHLTGDSLWFGIKNDGGTRKLGWVRVKNGVQSAFTAVENPSTDATYYLRITQISSGNYVLWWSLIGFDDVGSTSVHLGSVTNIDNVGMAAMSTAATVGGTLTATFDDFLCRIPHGDRAFYWYAYRDLALPGVPDMIAADAIIRTIKPAHTYAHAISKRSVLCDDVNSGCDMGPLGAL